jgi:hypothetical protein
MFNVDYDDIEETRHTPDFVRQTEPIDDAWSQKKLLVRKVLL